MRRRNSLLIVLSLALLMAPSTATAVETGKVLIADEARATFSYGFSYDLGWTTCDVTYDIWVSVLVGKHGELAPGGALQDISRLYASNNIVDTCFGDQFFEGEVALDSEDVEYVPLESFTIDDVYVDIRSEYGYVQFFRLDLTWIATSDLMHQGYDMGRPPTVFQVENFVWADVTGTFEINYDLLLPGEPWGGDISRLRQIGPPAP
jgi:hypothetical protein